MADGRTKQLAALKVGDRIYGTVRGDKYRRYVATEVLAHWETLKDAYRIALEDGTELVASGDHRFWTRRGKWKNVTGAEQGPLQRPHLTLNDHLAGVGQLAQGPDQAAPIYRRGYLCGLLRGDANLKTCSDRRAGRAGQTLHRFRLALADFEALRRAREFLVDLDMFPEEFVFSAASGEHREIRAIREQSRAGFERISDAIAWPRGVFLRRRRRSSTGSTPCLTAISSRKASVANLFGPKPMPRRDEVRMPVC